jgi:ketosteroid isomerase-like protein
MSNETVTAFLQGMADTATNMDLDAHMDLISQKVQLFGVPGFEVIGYDDWFAQCQHEFSAGVIKKVSYQGLKIITPTPKRIMFKTIETVEATDGTRNVMGIEVILEQEEDGKWRISQERVLAEDELAHDKQSGLLDS